MESANNLKNANSSTWENVYIFISSTFNDMHAERDYLVKKVFPELSEWCEKRRLRLIDIDLRWGVTEKDSEQNKRVVDVCLTNIDRCRPLFLCFLGQRRGWIPGEHDISMTTFENFPKLKQYLGSSVTEMEITHALIDPMLNGSVLELQNKERAYFFMRDPSYLEQVGDQAVRNIYTNEGESDPSFTDKKLAEFKENIRRNSGRPVFDYSVRWDKSASTPELAVPGKPESISKGRPVDFTCENKPLSETVIEALKNAITEIYPDRKPENTATALSKEMDEQYKFLQAASDGYIERAGDFDSILEYINGNDHRPCAVVADAGTGKTSYLASLIQKFNDDPDINVIYRFIGTSEGTVSLGKMLPTIVSEITTRFGISNLPSELQKIKNTLADILAKASVKSGKKTVLIIDAVNQLESSLNDLSWVPVWLPENVKFIYSFKLNDSDGDALYSSLQDGNTCLIRLKPFESSDDRRALIAQYLSRYLKELDEEKIEQLISSDGAENPLFLKILLSELRVFGSHEGLRELISGHFGSNPLDAFNEVLARLEEDPGYSKVPGRTLVPNVFGWLSHSKNGLEAAELADLLVDNRFAESHEDALDSVNLILRQIRPFLAKRDTKSDFFYESFMLAARSRYTDAGYGGKPHTAWHKDIHDYLAKRSYTDKRELYEQAYQAAYAGLTDKLIGLLTNFNYLQNKTDTFDIYDTIGDFDLVTLSEAGVSEEDRAQLLLIRDALEMSVPMVKLRKDQLAVQFTARLQGFDMPLVDKLLKHIRDYNRQFNVPWLRPLYSFLKQPGSNLIREYEKSWTAELFADRKRILIYDPTDSAAKVVETVSGRVLRNYPLQIKPDHVSLFEKYGVFAVRTVSYLEIVDMETGKATRVREVTGISTREWFSYENYLVLTDYQRFGNDKYIDIVDVKKKEVIKKLMYTIPQKSSVTGAFDQKTGRLYITHKERLMSVYDAENGFSHVKDLEFPDASKRDDTPWGTFAMIPEGEDYLITKTGCDGIVIRNKKTGQIIWNIGICGQGMEPFTISDDHRMLACGSFGKIRLYSIPKKQLIATLADNTVSTNYVTALCFTASDKKLRVGRKQGQIELWDVQTGEMFSSYNENTHEILALKEGADGCLIVPVYNGNVSLFDTSRLSVKPNNPFALSAEHTALAPNNRFLIVVTSENLIYRVDIPSMKCTKLVDKGKKFTHINSPIITCDSKYFAVCCWLKTLEIYDCVTGEYVATMPAAKIQKRGLREKDYNIWNPSFLPEGRCIGRRNLTVVYTQGQFVVVQDADEPDKTRAVYPFDGKTPAWERMANDGAAFIVKASRDSASSVEETDAQALTSDGAVLFKLPSLECVKHTKEFKELYIETLGLDTFPEIERQATRFCNEGRFQNNEDNPIDMILKRPGLTLYRANRWYELNGATAYTIRNAESQKEICSYIAGSIGKRLFTRDGRYFFFTAEHILAAFELENAFSYINAEKEKKERLDKLNAIRKDNMAKGDALKKSGKLSEARESYLKAFDACEQIVSLADLPDECLNFAICNERLGNLAKMENDFGTALTYYERQLKLNEEIFAQTGTVKAKYDITISFINIGDAEKKLGNTAQAKEMYLKSYSARRKLVAKDNSLNMRFNYSISMERLGDAERAEGNLKAAWNYHFECAEVREEMVKENRIPSYINALNVSYDRLKFIAKQMGNMEESNKYAEKQRILKETMNK